MCFYVKICIYLNVRALIIIMLITIFIRLVLIYRLGKGLLHFPYRSNILPKKLRYKRFLSFIHLYLHDFAIIQNIIFSLNINKLINWLELPRPALCRILLPGLDYRGLWLNSLLLDVSPPFVCGAPLYNMRSLQIVYLTAGETTPEDALHWWRWSVEQKRIQP